jgi:uncharacterized surface protein with fasciclin (FAS1) repeats
MANIVDTAAGQKQLTTFVAALQKTSLLGTLKGAGTFTVFAPTDDAFDDLPEGAVNRLLLDPAKVTAVLAYHIVTGRFTSADAARLSSAVTTLEGSDLRVASTPSITLNGAHITQADLLADNGVIHIIDRVLIPLDDLGNVQVEYSDITVVAPNSVYLVDPGQENETAR